AVAVDARDRRKVERRQVEVLFAPTGLGSRNRGALAGRIETESMIGANELFGVADALGHQSRAAMAAGIQIAAERAAGPAHDEHRLAADMCGKVIARIADMGLVAEKDPIGLED